MVFSPSVRWDLRILVIEDDPNIARILLQDLQADYFAVALSNDGEEGLHVATQIDYDLVVRNWFLTKMDGLTVLKMMRKAASTKRTLLLTARCEVSDRVSSLQVGADNYLVKPIAFENL